MHCKAVDLQTCKALKGRQITCLKQYPPQPGDPQGAGGLIYYHIR